MGIGVDAYQLAFEISPIWLTGGALDNIPGGTLPIILLTQAVNFTAGLLGGTFETNLDNYFAHFRPMPGSKLIDNQVGTYPFANQTVAGNAIIAQPTTLSMLMTCPARGNFSYWTRLASMIAITEGLKKHNSLGGTYTILTPTYPWTKCIMTGMSEVSAAQSKQSQIEWQFDFYRPLLTLDDAEAAQSSLMSKLTNETQTAGDSWSGISPTVGAPGSIGSPVPLSSAAGGPSFTGGASEWGG